VTILECITEETWPKFSTDRQPIQFFDDCLRNGKGTSRGIQTIDNDLGRWANFKMPSLYYSLLGYGCKRNRYRQQLCSRYGS
jgi:hypothetical protein